MQLDCSVLGRDVQITDAAIPVISPYWRLKRSGDWSLLCKYEPEQISYSILSPLVGATLALMDGRLTFRHLSMVVQYAHEFDSLEKSNEFLTQVIAAANKDNDAIVAMSDQLTPYVKKYDPLEFVEAPPEDQNQKRLAGPLSLNLMFSNDCETSCAYCYAQRRNVPPARHLSTERWLEIFREARALGMEQVSLSGGDPLFRRDSLALIAELIKLKMLFLLSTKCHVTGEMADRLVEIGMNEPVNQYTREIQLSMDGPDEETADILSGSPGYFHRAIDSIRNLVERGFNLRVKAVLTPLNAPRVYEWVELMAGLGVEKLSVAAYNRTFYRHDDGLFLSREDRELIGDQCRRARADFPGIELRMTGIDPALAQDKPHLPPAAETVRTATEPAPAAADKARRWKERAHCSGGRSSMTITPDGKVVLCDTIPQEGIFVVGDVSIQSVMEVWNSQKLLDFAYPPRERFAGSACHDCADLDECQSKAGYCFRDTYFNYGTAFGPPPSCPCAQDDGMRME
ncbi:radical SAM protein [Geobacter hydrogenophilus]|uniref:Radical SAM/SPASM domain-containing protein n=1 Tax=Geobacter hydrogenophilus TaxID=40983 RepID=A0A9W6G2U8_9BACT|nr:radical SAM protein [Geobacter hydrogenophilus]MBT0892552.1 radical SAM protein [Geobacter hydrogenophilus]GLI39949.1 radical SAM/SPASM domain-containing protein [Geobacter hydrogenophilus]